jgi:hypothetical protein
MVRMIIDTIKVLKAKAVRQQESQTLFTVEINTVLMLITLFASATSTDAGLEHVV